jgi:hypothetical protein
MKEPHNLDSMVEVLNFLKEEGFKEDFQMSDKGLMIKDQEKYFEPDDLIILKVYRFEGDSNPDDMAVVYQIESKDGDKGVYIDAFGLYADHDDAKAAEFLKRIKTIKDH